MGVGRWTQKGKTKYQGRQLRLQEVAEVLWFLLTEWKLVQAVEGNHERSVVDKSEKRHSDLKFTLQPKKARTEPAGMSRNSGSAFISSPIGLANKLVQFKKRPSYSCSLKAAYTKTYEKNLWYKEFQNTKNFTLTLSPSCYTFIKEGVR